MHQIQIRRAIVRQTKRWSVWIALCVLLWTAGVESTHNHPSQASASACSICLAAQTANPTASSAPIAPVFDEIGIAHEEDVVAQAQLDFSNLEIRGPPVL